MGCWWAGDSRSQHSFFKRPLGRDLKKNKAWKTSLETAVTRKQAANTNHEEDVGGLRREG